MDDYRKNSFMTSSLAWDGRGKRRTKREQRRTQGSGGSGGGAGPLAAQRPPEDPAHRRVPPEAPVSRPPRSSMTLPPRPADRAPKRIFSRLGTLGAVEEQFVEGGGYSERLAAQRLAERERRKNPTDPTDRIPACPRCGKAMVLRTAKSGKNAGQRFWGCSGYPQCKGVAPA